MKKVLILTVALIFVFSGMAFASVIGSKHDMTSTGLASGSISDGTTSGTTDQVCVFCHHPHRTNASTTAAELLWNRNNGSATKAYTTYDSTNLVATGNDALATDINAKHTRVCLSCHDSSYAASVVDTTPIASSLTAGYTAFSIGATAQANIGGDTSGLQNDHPVDFSYAYVQSVNNEFPAVSGGNAVGASYTWKLYNGTMQCGTCHEPHTSYLAAGVAFIRNAASGVDPLSGSAMCNDCHTLH